MMYLLSDWLVKQLLLFDMILYGSIVRDTMAEIDLHAFVDDGGIITCNGPISSMSYLERLLHQCILTRAVDTNSLSATTITYVFDHIDRRVTVCISYYKCIQKELPCRNIDVNGLCLSRTGLFLSIPNTFQPSIFQSHPCPLLTVLEQCQKKEFSMLNLGIPDGTADAKRLIEKGWTMVNGAVHAAADVPEDDVCSICNHGFSSQSIETRCGHVFHTACWNDYLRSKPRVEIIPCPMCRHEMQRWEALVPFKI